MKKKNRPQNASWVQLQIEEIIKKTNKQKRIDRPERLVDKTLKLCLIHSAAALNKKK